jgi:hypothetical protein
MYSILHVVVHLSINNIKIYNFLICLSRLLRSLVVMDYCCKSYVETDLTSLHYITFIESLTVLPTETLSFDSKKFANKSIKVVEARKKKQKPFLIIVALQNYIFKIT